VSEWEKREGHEALDVGPYHLWVSDEPREPGGFTPLSGGQYLYGIGGFGDEATMLGTELTMEEAKATVMGEARKVAWETLSKLESPNLRSMSIHWYHGDQLVGEVQYQSRPDGLNWGYKAMVERAGGNHVSGEAEDRQDAIDRVEQVISFKLFPGNVTIHAPTFEERRRVY
jgi:hypothetical protein